MKYYFFRYIHEYSEGNNVLWNIISFANIHSYNYKADSR